MSPNIYIDPEHGVLTVRDQAGERSFSFSDPEAFALLSELWLRCGFDNKYVYGFTWLGRPVLQLPEDLLRIQEVVYALQPDWIVETGVAHGGSLIFYASLCEAIGKGRVVGIDVEIRQQNRAAIESHRLGKRVHLIEGNSIEPDTVAKVTGLVGDAEVVLVVLDSKHTKHHVLQEMEAYGPLVSENSYLVVADGIMAQVASSPLAGADWLWNNPLAAINEYLSKHPEFRLEEPAFPFNEGAITRRVTYWPMGFLKKRPSGGG
ncbi:MAG: CmcI family methyltransferase [bacterium]